jgi:hypothetical protein
MPTHIVKQGDCITSIAKSYGFFWETIWNHGDNAQLKQDRGDPNVLNPGDKVVIPDKQKKEESRGTEARHKFILKGEPAKLRLRLTRDKKKEPKPGQKSAPDGEAVAEEPDYEPYKPEVEPRANTPFSLEIDGKLVKEGSTDGDGRIEISLPPNARGGKLILHRGKPEEETIPLALGHLDPIDITTGVRKRLKNLGFFCAETGDEVTPDLESALHKFQEANGLTANGKIDDPTKNKLKEIHGS